MPIVPHVGRRSVRIRLALGIMYALLGLGGLTMVWPFAITLTQSLSNQYEFERYDAWPRYLFDRFERYAKYLAERYDDAPYFAHFRAAYGAPPHWGMFRDLAYDPRGAREALALFGREKTDDWPRLVARYDDYVAFLEQYDLSNSQLLFNRKNIKRYQQFVLDRYGTRHLRETGRERRSLSRAEYEGGALELMGRVRRTNYRDLLSVRYGVRVPFDLQMWIPVASENYADYLDFMRRRPAAERIPATRHFLWTNYLLGQIRDPADLEWPDGNPGYSTVYDIPFHLPADAPRVLHDLKHNFLRDAWPVRLVRIAPEEEAAFREFVRDRYPSLQAYNLVAEISYERWDDIPFDTEAPVGDNVLRQTQWRDFVLSLPRERWELLAPETEYQRFLLAKYGHVAAIEERYGCAIPDIRELRLPVAESDYVYYVLNRDRFLRGFLIENFATAIEYMAVRGRAFFNTVVLIVFSMLAALTINPMAAYALSRFRPRQTYQMLLLFLATMAFPPMVAAIPSFLLLRDLGLLNTYAALILPSIANGYSIFLLKGFFDSLPQELYEAASLDGATEGRMFLVISLPLIKPILAVIALNTFIASYGGFMWALIVCQKQEMWTISVWMFQFYQQVGSTEPYLATAGMVLASLPTLLVFVFCQKLILRGIVIPTMK